jgi:protein O-GlcNAc transferase
MPRRLDMLGDGFVVVTGQCIRLDVRSKATASRFARFEKYRRLAACAGRSSKGCKGNRVAAARSESDAFVRAVAALNAGNADEAARLFTAVLRKEPRHVGALNLLGVVLTRLGRFAEAESCLRRALQEQPGSDATLFNYGAVLKALNRPTEALERFSQALAINPGIAETWHSRGTVRHELRRFDEAVDDFAKATELKPGWAQAWLAYGNALCALGRYDEGVAAYDKALALAPNWAAVHCNRGAALLDLQRYAQALASSDRAIALAPDMAVAHSNRAGALAGLKCYAEALASCDRAFALEPNHADGWLVRGNVLIGLARYDDAFAAYERVLAAQPDFAEAWLGRGRVLAELNRYDQALLAYERALALKPQLAEAWFARGDVFAELRRHGDALAAYEKALALKPDLPGAAGACLLAKLHTCAWTNLPAEIDQLLAVVRDDKLASAPFVLLALPASAADQLQCAKRFVREHPVFSPVWQGEIYAHDRIRIAYLSSDLRDHAVSHLTVGLFEHHDRSRFEITGLSFGPDDNSAMRQRVRRAFEHFYDMQHKSDDDVAQLMRRLEIDIAVDLNGFTAGNRFKVLARRAAPIQVNYLGYSATMGADCVDYILADSTLIPADQCAFYSERVVWLPGTFQVNDDRRAITERIPTRQECGLPETGFVFCCFNNAFKISPQMFDVWMRLLKEIEGSVLWLRRPDAATADNLRREAERRGVVAARLVFAPPVPLMADHLARHRQADLFLDTLPYNAHTTTSDALWAGLPVLTCCGATFAGRVAASLLMAVGLDELVASSLEDYEALALRLAREPSLLAALRSRLSDNRTSCALFDSARATRNFEAAYTTMWERYQKGETAPQPGRPLEPIRIAER